MAVIKYQVSYDTNTDQTIVVMTHCIVILTEKNKEKEIFNKCECCDETLLHLILSCFIHTQATKVIITGQEMHTEAPQSMSMNISLVYVALCVFVCMKTQWILIPFVFQFFMLQLIIELYINVLYCIHVYNV